MMDRAEWEGGGMLDSGCRSCSPLLSLPLSLWDFTVSLSFYHTHIHIEFFCLSPLISFILLLIHKTVKCLS